MYAARTDWIAQSNRHAQALLEAWLFEAERVPHERGAALPGRFSVQPYHDFIIRQGLLPFDLLEKAVMEQFVPTQRAAR